MHGSSLSSGSKAATGLDSPQAFVQPSFLVSGNRKEGLRFPSREAAPQPTGGRHWETRGRSLDRRPHPSQQPSGLEVEGGQICGLTRVRPTPTIIRNPEVALFHRCQKCSCICRVLGCNQDFNLTKPVEGQAVGFAKRFSAGRRRDTVSFQKRAHLRLFWLTLRGVDDGPLVFHLKQR